MGKEEEDLIAEQQAAELILKEDQSLGAVFADADWAFEKRPYDVKAFYKTVGVSQAIARSSAFDNITISVVVLNAIFIGVESDWNKETNLYESSWAFQACAQFFAAYFAWELAIRFLAFEDKINCLRDGWFKFDLFLVGTMVLDTWILMPILYFAAGGGVTIPTQPFRMLRLAKLTRMARLMRVFPELVTM